MEIEIIKNEKDYIEVAIRGEDVGFVNAIKELLLEDKGTEFAAYRLDHPVLACPVLMLRTKEGNALSALKFAVKKLKKQAVEFKEALKDAKKPKNQ